MFVNDNKLFDGTTYCGRCGIRRVDRVLPDDSVAHRGISRAHKEKLFSRGGIRVTNSEFVIMNGYGSVSVNFGIVYGKQFQHRQGYHALYDTQKFH